MSNLINILKTDVTKHFLYTFFVVVMTSFVSCSILFLIFNKKFDSIQSSLANTIKTTVILPNPSENLYTERGSPYDNRTIGSESANVIFHGPRDKKRIALTFDAEMTDGMKANLQSGRVKTSYNKKRKYYCCNHFYIDHNTHF